MTLNQWLRIGMVLVALWFLYMTVGLIQGGLPQTVAEFGAFSFWLLAPPIALFTVIAAVGFAIRFVRWGSFRSHRIN